GVLPTPGLTLSNITIGMDADGRFAAGSLRIELALGPLMRGELRATEMKVVSPRVALRLDRDGQPEGPALPLSAAALPIERLAIEDGTATLTDAASGTRMVLGQLWFSGEARSLAGPVRGSGAFVTGGGLYGYEISLGRRGPEGSRLRLRVKTDERLLQAE